MDVRIDDNNKRSLTSVTAMPMEDTYSSVLMDVSLANGGVAPAASSMTDPTMMVDKLAEISAPVLEKMIWLNNNTTLMPLSCCPATIAHEMHTALMLPRLANSSPTPDRCFFDSSTDLCEYNINTTILWVGYGPAGNTARVSFTAFLPLQPIDDKHLYQFPTRVFQRQQRYLESPYVYVMEMESEDAGQLNAIWTFSRETVRFKSRTEMCGWLVFSDEFLPWKC